MAIAQARVEYPGRSVNGGNANACCKSAYNARSIIRDGRTGVVYNWEWKGGNVFHEMLLPDYVDKKFKSISTFANEVEHSEKRKDSQLFEEWVLALPKEEEVTLEMKIELILEYVKEKGWVEEGLGVQIDIHEPHGDDVNWHAHILVTTRRFRKDGLGLEDKKASDLKPEIKYGKVQKSGEIAHHIFWKNVQERKFEEWGLDLKCDLPHEITQEHIGPVRMRSVMNAAVLRNEEKMQANIENLSSGADLLRYVSKHMSVFSENDLMRATKIIDGKEQREALVADALKNQSLVVLYEEDGKESGYYTTREVRKEEEKILRLSGYVAAEGNVLVKGSYRQMAIATALTQEAKQNGQLTGEQYEALSHILFNKSGVRVLRGRAGTGKSHVLGRVASIAEAAGLNVIGLAPTHKARGELAAKGYANNDTVKGMLFKHYNGRFELPKGSIIVLDEAGMVGNDDYQELLRVVVANKCNIILAGDERQLSSVQRGGMFEVFDREYGSVLIANIQRQKAQWGRDVAMAMSRGEIRSGVKILHEKGKIIEHGDKQSSMQGLIEDWSKSDKRVEDRLIIAISNKDVAALNHGVRQYLKLEGALSGEEIRVGAHYYQKGDRILITQTNKELGLTNGDYAQVVEATADKFVIGRESNDSSGDRDSSSDNKAQGVTSELIEFSPKDYGGFKHGYATTVFKAQGASISDVYVYHAGYGWMRNSYVALSRCVDEMKLYVNKESTKSIDQLVRQLGNNTYEGSSLIYQTKEDIAAKETKAQEDSANESSKGILGSIWKGFDKVAEAIGTRVVKWADKSLALDEYYQYEKLEIKQHIVEEVLAEVYEELAEKEVYQEQKVAVGEVGIGGNSGKVRLFGSSNTGVNKSIAESKVINVSNTKVVLTPKEKFYANRDRLKQNEINRQQRESQWNRDQERLRSEVRYKVEDIARDLLGPENKRLSHQNSLRWGEHGKLAMHIRGERAGIWCDFSSGKGGDIFDLVQDIRKSDFKAAVEYLEAAVGFKKSASPHIKLVYDHNNSDVLVKALKQREEETRIEKQKQEQVMKLYDRSKEIGDKSIAHKYLKDTRGIEVELGQDIRTAGIFVREQSDIETKTTRNKGKYYPALIAFARNKEGEITGGQQILLDKESSRKADLAVVKKSFGKISGSFVHLGEEQEKHRYVKDKDERITIISEGLETALSVKQALASEQVGHLDNTDKNINILCSLGISNIRNYKPAQGEKIIIAADNDGENNITVKTIATAKEELEQRGAFVEVVMPSKEGDFNDVLKVDGEQEIKDTFKNALTIMKETALQQLRINEEFGKLEKEKSQAKTVEEVVTILTKEQQLSNRLAKESPAIFDRLADWKLNSDFKVVESVKRESEFLLKNNIVSEKALVETIQNSKDIKLTASDMFNECRSFAQTNVRRNITMVKRNDELGREEESFKHMKNIQDSIKPLNLYFDQDTRNILIQYTNRLKVYEIAQEHSHKHPEQSQKFKEEMQSLNRFAISHTLQQALDCYKDKGLVAATVFAEEKNSQYVISRLASMVNIQRSEKSLHGKDYIDAIAKDSEIMRYVDKALSKGERFVKPQPEDNNLLAYANQRDVNTIISTIKEPQVIDRFKSKVTDILQYSNNENLKNTLEIFKDKGINHFEITAENICRKAVMSKIEHDFQTIRTGGVAEGFDKKNYRDKSEYLYALNGNKNIMQYIDPKFDIGKELEQPKQVSNDFGLER